MCALFGWLDYKGIIPHKILKKLTQALANAAEERGTDAAGISYINDGKVTVYKRPIYSGRLFFVISNVFRYSNSVDFHPIHCVF